LKEKISLKCLNPQGLFQIPEPEGLSNPRLADLTGKTIGLIWDGKKGGDNFCTAVENIFKEKHPRTNIQRIAWRDVTDVEKAKNDIDAFIYGVGDSGMGGWGQSRQAIELERMGKPGVFIIADNAIHTTKMSLSDAGMPAMRVVSLPSLEYFPNRQTVGGLKPVVEAAFERIVQALIQPLTPQEKNPPVVKSLLQSDSLEIKAESYELLLDEFNRACLEKHWGDGLPLIPSTTAAVESMLSGINRPPDDVIGRVPYRNGIATIQKIAVNAVMAGARPQYLPVITAALDGIISDYGFTHMMSSEGSFNLAILVSGPIAAEINMNCGVGLLGHGCQANNTIGRAIRLCLINLGYLWPGEIDMALIGRASSHTFYTFAENMAQSPWEPFNIGLGFGSGDSSVTVSTVSSPKIYGGGVVEPWNVETFLDDLTQDLGSDRLIFGKYKLGTANPAAHFRKHILVVHPEMAIILKRYGFKTARSFKDYILDKTAVPYEQLSEKEVQGIQSRLKAKVDPMFFGADNVPDNYMRRFKATLKAGGKVPVILPDDLHIVVSGSAPGYTFGWSYFKSAHQTRLIKDALLTESGR
jgi:hypothetical protein